MTIKRKYKQGTMDEKLIALKELSAGKPIREVADQLGVAVGTIASWKKKEDEIKLRALENKSIKSQRPARLAGNAAVLDTQVYAWFLEARARKKWMKKLF